MGTFHHSVSQQNAKQFLTNTIFETGAYNFPSKYQNPTVLSPEGPASTQCLHPNTVTGFASGALVWLQWQISF